MPDTGGRGAATRLRHLTFELAEGDDGIATLEAMASSRSAPAHAAAEDEAARLLAWVRCRWPGGEGPPDDGGDWDHLLERRDEPGGWRTVVLTLTGRPMVIEAVAAAFRPAGADADDLDDVDDVDESSGGCSA